MTCVIAAVRPTPEDPRPVVETASGATFITYLCKYTRSSSCEHSRILSLSVRVFDCPSRQCVCGM